MNNPASLILYDFILLLGMPLVKDIPFLGNGRIALLFPAAAEIIPVILPL